MSNIKERLERIIPKILSDEFIQSRGLGNEIGFYVFDYEPQYELLVRDYIQHIKRELNYPGSDRQIIEYDLFNILLDIARDKKILEKIPEMEKKKGRQKLFEAVINAAGPDAYIAKMNQNRRTGDVIFITGVGKVYPFMRSHNILNNLHHIFDRVPVILFFPGTYDGQSLKLFNRFNDDNYYRAFQLIK